MAHLRPILLLKGLLGHKFIMQASGKELSFTFLCVCEGQILIFSQDVEIDPLISSAERSRGISVQFRQLCFSQGALRECSDVTVSPQKLHFC